MERLAILVGKVYVGLPALKTGTAMLLMFFRWCEYSVSHFERRGFTH